VPSEIRLQKPGIECYLPDDTISKGWLPGSSGSCVIKLAKAFMKIYISKRQRKIYNYKFSDEYSFQMKRILGPRVRNELNLVNLRGT
jgi:hypothetical protein